MLKQYSSGNTTVFLKINGKTLEHPEPCSVLGQGTTPGLGLGGEGVVVHISDLKRLAGMPALIHCVGLL